MDERTKKLIGATATPLASIFGSGFLGTCGVDFGKSRDIHCHPGGARPLALTTCRVWRSDGPMMKGTLK